ncbi:MAG TPA: hypothetical protein ENK66_09210 [Arcobacter sp.]|nr:hypothetical protein [Arcobacter sp.]
MYLFMYKNSIEKTTTLSKALLQGKYFILGVLSWLKVWLKKCNYREYLLVFYIEELHLLKVLQSPKIRETKGTIWGVTFKGTGECEKKLDTNFFNLVKSHWDSQSLLKPFVMGVRSTFLTRLKLG